jgi:hypothetical protein
MRSTPAAVVHHVHGRRLGVREVYRFRRIRIRGDGAGSAKNVLVLCPQGGLVVRDEVRTLIRDQLATIRLKRLPFATFRLLHLAASYRECLRDYAVALPEGASNAEAVLVPRRDGSDRRTTAAAIRLPAADGGSLVDPPNAATV